MNHSWRWCKHLPFVYLLIIPSVLLLGSLSASSATESEPTEEPVETNNTSTISTFATSSSTSTFKPIPSTTVTATTTSTSKSNVSASATSSEEYKPKGDSNEKLSEILDGDDNHDQLQARALFRSGNVWKRASRMLSKGLRMVRESLVEGAKVAHMFKEDFDEGMSTIMRQNRGVKQDNPQQQGDGAQSSSFFDSQMLREGVLGGILRFMGINSKQVGVIALNCLIILAEWITSSMIGSNEVAGATSRMIKTNLLEWASTGHNSQMEKLLAQARSHTLPEKLIDSLSQKTGNSTSCVQLLLCKMSPIIWGFQDTVKDQFNYTNHQPDIKTARKTENTTNGQQEKDEPRGFLVTSQHLWDKFVGHLPEKNRILDFGERCETKYPHCQLLKFKGNR